MDIIELPHFVAKTNMNDCGKGLVNWAIKLGSNSKIKSTHIFWVRTTQYVTLPFLTQPCISKTLFLLGLLSFNLCQWPYFLVFLTKRFKIQIFYFYLKYIPKLKPHLTWIGSSKVPNSNREYKEMKVLKGMLSIGFSSGPFCFYTTTITVFSL